MGMLQEKSHILVVDDDDRLRQLLKKFLTDQGYLVTAAADAAEARRILACFAFDLMILDVMMPGETGFSLLKSLAEASAMPVLMLSAMGGSQHRIEGLETGAEDYLTKPFEPKELLLRIRTIVRRRASASGGDNSIRFGDCVFDPAANTLTCAGRAVALTTGEAALLKTLAESIGRPVSREALASVFSGGGSERSVDVQVNRLRKKIEEPDGAPIYLQTVRGAGYVLYGRKV